MKKRTARIPFGTGILKQVEKTKPVYYTGSLGYEEFEKLCEDLVKDTPLPKIPFGMQAEFNEEFKAKYVKRYGDEENSSTN